MSRIREIPNLDNLIRRYLAGEPESKLARESNVNRWTFRRRLLAAGITPRNVSDSMYIRWQNATEESRHAMLDSAHKAAKGRSATVGERELRALTVERTQIGINAAERLLANWLIDLKLSVTPQKAVSIYNIDVAINEPAIAVEIFGGHWHASGEHAARFFERTEYLLNRNWSVIIVWVDGIRYPLTIDCAQYILALSQKLSADPAIGCQYRVISGDAKPMPVRSDYFNTPSIIERFSHRV